MLGRRGLLGGLAALAAPAIVRTPGLLMAVRPVRLYGSIQYRPMPEPWSGLRAYWAGPNGFYVQEGFDVRRLLTTVDMRTNMPDAAKLTGARLVEV